MLAEISNNDYLANTSGAGKPVILPAPIFFTQPTGRTPMDLDQEHLRAGNVQRFDEAATDWEEKPQRVALARTVAEAIRRTIPLAATMRVLEYGCGTGMVSRALSPHVAHIVAVDTSPRMLEVLRQKAGEEKIDNIETLVHDLTQQPLQAESFDLVVSSMTLHHIPDIEPLLQRLFDILKPGGYLAVADLVTEDGSFHDDNSGVAHHGIDPEIVRGILAKNGGQDIGVQEIHAIEKPRENGVRQYPVFLARCRKA